MTQALVDTGAPFLKETSEIASEYLELCFQELELEKAVDRNADPQSRSPAPGRRVDIDSSTDSNAASGPPLVGVSPAQTIAQRLKKIGDELDEKVKREWEMVLGDELKLRSVILLGPEQFSSMCQRVLTLCSSCLNTGWEQAAVVFMGVFRVANVLRSQNEDTEQRLTMVMGYVGDALRDLRLQSWIETHGGLSQSEAGATAGDYVPFESEV